MDQTPGTTVLSFPCPYLAARVELTDERLAHIRGGHPEFANSTHDRIATTLADPDEIRIAPRFPATRLSSRWFEGLLGGEIVVVAVVTDSGRAESLRRWVVTAYVTRRIIRGISKGPVLDGEV